MDFDRLTVGLLVRRSDAPKLGASKEDELQDQHLAHLARLHDDGHLVGAGPLLGEADRAVRGLLIFRGTVSEARAWEAEDPWVRAGYLECQLFPWWVPKGALTFSRTRFPRSRAEAD